MSHEVIRIHLSDLGRNTVAAPDKAEFMCVVIGGGQMPSLCYRGDRDGSRTNRTFVVTRQFDVPEAGEYMGTCQPHLEAPLHVFAVDGRKTKAK